MPNRNKPSRTTLWYHANDRPSKKEKAASQQYPPPQEEEALVQCLLRICQRVSRPRQTSTFTGVCYCLIALLYFADSRKRRDNQASRQGLASDVIRALSSGTAQTGQGARLGLA